eukprot:TRINITY_DN22931_c0_g1_i1.p1 TRINITY_DN22931_c0_g1~~TRINITY_DN22931_c0_g1_i1.p1  ORF type:complete len:114 (+),score=27.47 TRINITY_DN22931_c0_g1_i1:214-555(+)
MGEGATTTASTLPSSVPKLFERRQVRSLYVPTLTSEVAIASTLSEIHHRHTTASMDGGGPSSSASVHPLSLIHISEPTRLLSISYAVFCLKKKKLPPILHYTSLSTINLTSLI